MVYIIAGGLFGRKVGRRANADARLGDASLPAYQFDQAKVGQQGPVGACQEDVGRFHITVYDSL